MKVSELTGFYELCAKQMVARLVALNDGHDNIHRALNQLHLIDQAFLFKTDYQAINDKFGQSPLEPAMILTHACIKNGKWSDYFNVDVGTIDSMDKQNIHLIDEPDDSELSEYAIELIDKIYDENKNKNAKAIRNP